MKKFTREMVRNRLSSIRSINYGGCLVAAYVMYLNELRNGGGEDFQIVQLNKREPWLIKNNKLFIEGLTNQAESDSHFGWTFDKGDTIFDSEKIVDSSEYSKTLLIPNEKTKEFCLSSLNNAIWNSYFEREIELPKVGKDLDLDLSEITLDNYWS